MTPPEEVAAHGAPSLLVRVPPRQRGTAVELAHVAFGGTAGAMYGVLPRGIRRSRWAGPAYGLVIWMVFEATVRPLLGLPKARRDLGERVAIAADHVLYGAILAAGRA